MSKLKTAYEAAVAKLGEEMPLALARAFGAVIGPDDVPAERVNGLVAALTRVANGGQISAAMARAAAHGAPGGPAPQHADRESVFRSIRAKAYGEASDDAEIPKTLSDLHAAAYAKWNRRRQKTD